MKRHKVSGTKKLANLEAAIQTELLDLKSEIEEADMLFGNWSKPISSVMLPKDINYFTEERSQIISQILQVTDAPQLKNIGDIMRNEVECAMKSDFTETGLPLLLHEFFVNCAQCLVQCKHLHLLRWRRFCQHTAVIEKNYEIFKKRLESIDVEFDDCKQRALRLSKVHDEFIRKHKTSMACVKSDDIAVYLCWLISSLRIVRSPMSYIRILQWIPVIHRNVLGNCSSYKSPLESLSANRLMSGDFSSKIPRQSELNFHGFVSDELTCSIPLQTVDLVAFRGQLECLAREYEIVIKSDLSSSADEMELFGSIIRQFKRLFNLQVECTTFYQYDCVPDGNEHWGINSPTQCLLKPCNWSQHVSIYPRKSATQEKQTKCLKQRGRLDEILLQCNSFLKSSDHALVVERLKKSGSEAHAQYRPKSMQVMSNRNGVRKTGDMWSAFYKNPEIREEFQSNKKSGKARQYEKSDNYDFSKAMQSLGLDESEETSSIDQHVVQGAYLSFLHLRVLKLRDIRRQALALLNYFRSIERTITIYDGGLSLEDDPVKPEENQSSRSHKSKKPDLAQKKPDGIGNHSYINSTPLDFKVGEFDFMQFGGIVNHDDFYQMDDSDVGGNGDAGMRITASSGSGISVPHVQDQRGYFVMYDLAVKDFEEIEQQLLLVASFFINKPKNMKKGSSKSSSSLTTFDILQHSNHLTDRFAVLLDIWTCHLNFLHSKRELLDCYLEAYANTFSPEDKHGLSQLITDAIHMQPLFDFNQDYFVNTYKLECSCLQLRSTLLKRVLDSQIEDSRSYIGSLLRKEKQFGMPYPIETTQTIFLNLPCSALLNMDLLEFHPTLGITTIRLSEALRAIMEETVQTQASGDLIKMLEVGKLFLELAIHEWEEMSEVGSSFSKQVQQQILSGQYSDSPILLEDTVIVALNETESNEIETKAEKENRAKVAWTNILEGVVLQNRLREVAWETEILARLYTRTCKALHFPESHMYLRMIQLEDASAKLSSDMTKFGIPLLSPEDANVDRYVPDNLPLAIHELDATHLSKFSFNSKTCLSEIIQNPDRLERIRISLACQIAHRNALTVAINTVDTCMLWDGASAALPCPDNNAAVAENEPPDSVKISQWFGRPLSDQGNGTATSNSFLYGSTISKRIKLPFLSIQLEKIPCRDALVNGFIKAKETSGLLLQKKAEVIKLKFKLVDKFCKDFSFQIGLHAMRLQIIAYYSALIRLLERVPKIKEIFFMIGRPHEKKRKLDDIAGMVPDPKSMHQRPRQVFSSDGKDFLNLWFLPHYTEIVFSYHLREPEMQWNLLRCWLEIVSSLHDIMQYLLGHASLGNITLGSSRPTISADWGGTEGIGAQLTEIQKQLNHVKAGTTSHTRSPEQVAEFLKLKRDTMFLEFEHGVHRYIQKFHKQESDSSIGYQGIASNAHFALRALSNYTRPSIFQVFMHVPESMKSMVELSNEIYPWLSFHDWHGHFPLKYRPQWNNVEDCMHLCLASLDENGRQKMNGELFGSAMIYQDVLNGGTKQLQSIIAPSPDIQDGFISSVALSSKKKKTGKGPVPGKKPNTVDTAEITDGERKPEKPDNDFVSEPLSKTSQPITSYSVLKTYFILSKQLEQVKRYWSARKLPHDGVNTIPISAEAERMFVAEIYIPVLQGLSREIGNGDIYDSQATLDDVPAPPPHTPEITLKANQLHRLLEVIELQMLRELRQKVSQETSLVLAERSRDETVLPTDLWKKGQIKETVSIGRPSLIQDFLHELLGDYTENDGTISFNVDHLNQCVFNLASAAMNREKQSFESYSTFYENLLHHHHHLLYQREREIEMVKLKSSEATGSRINAQFQLADHNRDLIVEVTALRAAVTENETHQAEREALIRQHTRIQYQELVQNLFQECFRMKKKLTQNQLSLYEDVTSLVSAAKNESLGMLKALRHQGISTSSNTRLNLLEEKDEKMKVLRAENAKLKRAIKKLQALHHWRRIAMKFKHGRNESYLFSDFMECKKELESAHLTSSQDKNMLEEQLLCARKAVEKASLDLNQAYGQLEREREEQKERLYREAKREQKRKHVSEMQKNNLQRLGMELVEKDKRLTNFLAEKDKAEIASDAWNSKTRKDVKKFQQQLMQDRTLKLEAFSRIDDLQAHVWDFEHMNSTPQTPGRIASSGVGSISGVDTSFALARATRPSSCFPSYKHNRADETKSLLTKRPSTSSARFRSLSARRKVHGLFDDGGAQE